MNEAVVLAFVLLFVKHWYIDFVNQSMEEVNGKGIYGNWLGIRHSLKHGAATALVFLFLGCGLIIAPLLGLIDFVIHYHTDWSKMNYGNRDITTPQFWNHLGLDQLVHYLTYLGLVYAATIL